MTLVTLRVVREKGSGLATIAKEQEDKRTDQHSRALSGLTTSDFVSFYFSWAHSDLLPLPGK